MAEMADPPGGPIKYSVINPCPPESSSPLILAIPATVLETASEKQRAQIAGIQLEFAQRVSRALLRSYGEIAVVLGGTAPSARKSAEPQAPKSANPQTPKSADPQG